MNNTKDFPPLVVIGLDGATWKIIDALISQGRLPNFEFLKASGSTAILQSMEPMVTPMLWTTIATGKLPEEHGITNFFDTQADLGEPRIWEILYTRGLSFGVFGWPLTDPPLTFDKSFMVPSWLDRSAKTFPANYSFIRKLYHSNSLRRKMVSMLPFIRYTWGIVEALSYSYVLLKMRKSKTPRDYIVKKSVDRFYIEFRTFFTLFKKSPTKFFAFYTNVTDEIPHLFWKYYQPELFPDVSSQDVYKYKDAIPAVYEAVDKSLGRLLYYCKNNKANLVILSDHGHKAHFHEYQRYICLGEELLRLLKLNDEVQYYRLGGEAHFVPKKGGKISASQLMKTLERIKIKGPNVPPNTPLFRISKNSLGELTVQSNHIAKTFGNRCDKLKVIIKDSDYRFSDLMDPVGNTTSGVHDEEGILIMKGPDIKENLQIQTATLLDIAPTLLTLLRLPVALDMKGKVLTEALQELVLKQKPKPIPSYGPRRFSKSSESDETDLILQERLRALGYL